MATNDWETLQPAAPLGMREALSAALAAAQGEFAPVVRDKTVKVTMKSGGSYTFSYAPLESILAAVKPALSKNGLALTQALETAEGKDYVETTLRHSSGQCISNRIPLFVRDDGPQAYGSALTYARRYGVTLLLCVSADDDDDGNASEGNQAETIKQKSESWRQIDPKIAASTANEFRKALKEESDPKIYEVHVRVNTNQDLYSAAWELLAAADRRQIKAAIDRMKAGGAGHPQNGMLQQ